jgi:very-short-patch-repair endonuclease
MANVFARKLRKQMTLEEIRVWSMVRRKQFGVRFNRQEPIGKYIADFISHKAKLIIEIDGDHHNHYGNDKSRDEYLNSLGWRILRLSNSQVRSEPNLVIDKIATALKICLLS